MSDNRRNCGRKKLPAEKLKQNVTVYVEQHIIDAWGGLQAAKQSVLNFLKKKKKQ